MDRQISTYLFNMKKAVFIFLVMLLALPVYSKVISTSGGPVEGTINGSVYRFLGVPYAQPPVVAETDTLHWKPPIHHEGWSEVFLADEFGHVCPQKSFEQGDAELYHSWQ